MAPEEIKEMFLAHAKLAYMSVLDRSREDIEARFNELSQKYRSECIEDIPSQPSQKTLDDAEALRILAETCRMATTYECQFHPNGMTDENINAIATTRCDALDYVVNRFMALNN